MTQIIDDLIKIDRPSRMVEAGRQDLEAMAKHLNAHRFANSRKLFMFLAEINYDIKSEWMLGMIEGESDRHTVVVLRVDEPLPEGVVAPIIVDEVSNGGH